MIKTLKTATLALLGLLLLLTGPAAAQKRLAEVKNLGDALVFVPVVEFAQLILTVTGPCDFQYRQVVEKGELLFQLDQTTIDGPYTYDLVRVETIDPGVIEILQKARGLNDEEIPRQLCREGRLPGPPVSQSEGFRVSRREIIYDPRAIEPQPRGSTLTPTSAGLSSSAQGSHDDLRNIAAADFVIIDDLIVDGSACIGFDCVNGESFGFDTIRLKENNLRIKFDDTSTASSYPRNDWQLTANDSANGGASKFSIDDISGNRTPFTVEANARSHSLYVDDGGRIGSRTSTPSTEIHTIDGDTPTLRLQQDGSSGFAPQTWDVAGNETNFFIRDVTNGSQLPFRIRPDAPTNSIFIDVSGDVGFGTSSPGTTSDGGENALVHITSSAGSDGGILIENTNATVGGRTMMELKNNGNTFFDLNNTNAHNWRIRSSNDNHLIFDDRNDTGTEFDLAPNGTLLLEGAVVQTSARATKENFLPVDPAQVLGTVAQLPLSFWSYKNQSDARHLGPMAEDFFAAFGLGNTDKGISILDAAGVSLAAIQGLNQVVEQKDAVIAELQASSEELKARVAELEALVQMLVEAQK